MAGINEMIHRFGRLNRKEAIATALDQTKDRMIELQREQLLEGKTSKGDDITPSYLDDPYFKSRQAAQRYSAWKDRITPHPIRKSGTPNLFINGAFHKSIEAVIKPGSVIISATFKKAASIEGKFKDIYGLNDEKTGAYTKVMGPVAVEEMKKQVYG